MPADNRAQWKAEMHRAFASRRNPTVQRTPEQLEQGRQRRLIEDLEEARQLRREIDGLD